MKVIIEINTDNGAFLPDPDIEIERILALTAGNIRNKKLLDINGNVVGSITVTNGDGLVEQILDWWEDAQYEESWPGKNRYGYGQEPSFVLTALKLKGE